MDKKEMKQSAVEWLEQKIEKLLPDFIGVWQEEFQQAKAMEKEQIKKLLEIIIWYDEESDVRPDAEIYNWLKQYYNETFKSE